LIFAQKQGPSGGFTVSSSAAELGSPTDPDKDGSEVECGLVSDGELVRPQGQTAPLLEPVDASLDRVALLVGLGIEGRRATT
jgi:hypothetical protein